MKTDIYSRRNYDYQIPSSFIAQESASPRDNSRILLVDRKKGDVLVLNNTRVIRARLIGKTERDSEKGKMKNIIKTLLVFCMVFVSSLVLAQDHLDREHHSHAKHIYGPVGVMGGHPHKKGEWMFSYSYSTMSMRGNRDGNNSISSAQVLNNFMVSPTKMIMQMHMFGLMYGINDKLTLMGMLPYSSISMDHLNRMGVRFTTTSEGISDIKLSGIYTLHQQGNRILLLNAGISFPTGSIDKRDTTPVGANQKLPYPMQLGSGTHDFLPGITYTDQQGNWSWGGQLKASVRFDKNDNDYRLGNEGNLIIWGARKLTNYASLSLRLDAKKWGDIHGADPELNPMMVPTSRTDLRGGERLDLLFGIDLTAAEGKLEGNKLAVEFGFPIYQYLDGPQLELDYRLTIGWQLLF